MTLLHLDFETFSELPLTGTKGVGTHRYFSHPSTEILLTAWAFDHDAVHVQEGPLLPQAVVDAAEDPGVTVVAFNAEFERLAMSMLLNVVVPPERFICSMARAWSLSFVGGLDQVCKGMHFPVDKQKLAKGKRLMQKFASPRRPSKHDPRTRWTADMDPEGWQLFRDYAAQDVVSSREVYAWCERYPWAPREREMWAVDQRINDAGWPLDNALVANADSIRIEEEKKLLGQLKDVTKLSNPNSVTQLSGWLDDRAVCLPNLQKDTVTEALEWLPEGEPREALLLRRQLARSTPKKWAALKRSESGLRIKATLEFGAAQRTQRWGGRVFQPQNLYTERTLDTDVLADILTHADRDTVEAVYGNVMAALAGGIRSAITAEPGKLLAVCDLASIESRILGWLAQEPRINDIFARGEDTYKDLASRLFNVSVENVTPEMRKFSKPPELGCGYYLGGRGLVAYAASMGVNMTEEQAQYAVNVWRESNPEVVRMWEWLDHAVKDVTDNYTRCSGYGVTIERDERFLFIELPSGRRIHYFEPLVRPFVDKNGEEWRGRMQLTYMGRYQDTGAWQRVYTHPGKVTENIDQAFARDILRDALLDCAAELPAPVVGHVHDEAVAEADEDRAEEVLAQMTNIMSRDRSWAPGLLLDAEGFTAKRYKKG